MSQLKYKRILLKLSGEILMGDNQFGYEHSAIESLCQDIKAAIDLGVEVCIVVGGGNICRGATLTKIGIERVSADYIGMLATVMNALALQSVLEKITTLPFSICLIARRLIYGSHTAVIAIAD